MKVAILGCGPAGLMAAHAVSMEAALHVQKVDLAIFSRKRPSQLFGAQYLHKPIPGATTGGAREVNYHLQGSVDGYRRKVYGPLWDGTVSPEDLTERHSAWDIRATYKQLWEWYEPSVNNMWIDPMSIRSLMENTKPDIIINSVPRDQVCYRGHNFAWTEVWAAGDAPDLGINVNSMYGCPENTVLCNGDPEVGWYRKSRVFEHTTVEWPGVLRAVPIRSASRVKKPTYHNCDCWPNIHHVGRYGTWEKGVLSHEAFEQAKDITRKALLSGQTA